MPPAGCRHCKPACTSRPRPPYISRWLVAPSLAVSQSQLGSPTLLIPPLQASQLTEPTGLEFLRIWRWEAAHLCHSSSSSAAAAWKRRDSSRLQSSLFVVVDGEFLLPFFLQIFSWVANKIAGRQESKRPAATSTAPYRKCTLNFLHFPRGFFQNRGRCCCSPGALHFSCENIRLIPWMKRKMGRWPAILGPFPFKFTLPTFYSSDSTAPAMNLSCLVVDQFYL